VKEFASGVAVAITVLGTAPYVLGMLRGRIRPHAFSWLIWGATTGIAFAGQIAGHGGIGAAATGASCVIGLAICAYAFGKGERAYTRLDWLCLAGAAAALVGWGLAGSPLLAVVLVSLVDAIAAIPTIRKAYTRPHEEGISMFVLQSVKWLFAIYALDRLNATTLLYPVVTPTVNSVIISVVLLRRAQLRSSVYEAAGG
jgi:hypothetical protein